MLIFPGVTDKGIRAEHENHFFMVTWVVEGGTKVETRSERVGISLSFTKPHCFK